MLKQGKKYVRGLSLVLIFTLLVTLFQIPWVENAKAAEKWGICELNYEQNKVTFKVKADGYSEGFVAGDFNNWKPWEQGEKYKLIWEKDKDNIWKMITSVSMDDLGRPKTKEEYEQNKKCSYKFVIYKDNNEEWMNGVGYNNGGNDSFDWKDPTEGQGGQNPPVSQTRVDDLQCEPRVVEKKVSFKAVAVGYDKVRVGERVENGTWTNHEMSLVTGEENTYAFELNMDGKPNGKYEYKFSLLPKGKDENVDENWTWLNKDKQNGDNSTFNWYVAPAVTDADFTIKASDTEVTSNHPVELVAVKIDEKKNITLVEDVTWELDGNQGGVTLSENRLEVSDTVPVDTKIIVKAYKAGETNKVAKKEITVKQAGNANEVSVHFLKQDGNYDGWNYWVFPMNPDKQVSFLENKTTDLGKVAFVEAGKKVIVRRKVGENDWAEQTPAYEIPAGVKNVYLIKDDEKVYTSIKEAFSVSGPRIKSAVMDSKEEIRAYLTEAPTDGVQFELYADGVKQDGITTSVEGTKVIFNTGSLAATFDPRAVWEVKADTTFTKPRKVLLRNVLDGYTFTGDMGVKYEENKVNFLVWAPTAHKVELLTYGDVSTAEGSPSGTYAMMHDSASGTYHITVNKTDVDKKYYLYRLSFKERDEEQASFTIKDRVTYAVDPYAIATGLNGKKGYVVDINSSELQPDNWENEIRPELKNPEDSILYEMHIRDFTIHSSWNGNPNYAGKFLGVAQSGTKYTENGVEVKTGLDHLEELGVTHVHLLPVYDIASIEEDGSQGFDAKKANGKDFNRNWGYDPQNYNALEGSYSTNPNDPTLVIKEFRTMVQALHKKNIRVVLDKVYNHMYSTVNMDKIVPNYYFRSNEEGKFTDGSGCGNEVATERPMVRKFVVDSNLMWVKNYKVDGLRFDLMALLDHTTMHQVQEKARQIDSSIIVYGEPWKAADSPLPEEEQTKKNRTGIAAFNDTYRDALRGNNNPSKGFVHGEINGDNSGKVQEGLKGSINGTVSDPELIINYVEAHDNYAIWDQIEKADLGVNDKEYRKDLNGQSLSEKPLADWRVKKTLLASGFVLTSQGIPFFQGGSEILRTKQGDHNSYKSDDTTNAIYWSDKAKFKPVFEFYKGLIKLRKEHPAFRMTSAEEIRGHQQVDKLMSQDGLIYNHLKNNAGGDKWKNIVVIYNGSTQDKNITWLPKVSGNKWKIVFDNEGLHEANLREVIQKDEYGNLESALNLSSSSFMILFDEEAKADDIKWDDLFADQSTDYMEPLEPSSAEPVKVRFRAAKDEIKSANVHYYDEADKQTKTIAMTKITDSSFYTSRNYDNSKIEFWEGVIPASSSTKYYNFEVINGTKSAWISGGAGENNRGITNNKPTLQGGGIDHGFSIVPDFKTPNTAKESVFYQIMVDRFRDGDSKNNRVAKDISQFGNPSEISAWGSEVFNGEESDKIWNNQFFGGDLIGVREAIPYFKYLGVDSLYLMPIFQSGSDHKYDADDYDHVDKNFGGNNALADLSKEAKENGINLVLDGVFNHTSTEGELFKKNKENYYFYEKNGYKDSDGKAIDFYAWHGYSNLAKLNYSKEEVKNLIYKGDDAIAKRYLKAPYNIAGWRLDAAEDVNTRPRDYKYNSSLDYRANQSDEEQKKANLDIWKEFREEVRKTKNDAYILGEFWENDNRWYYGKAWDSKMNYGGFLMPFLHNSSKNKYLGDQSLDNKGGMSVADIGKFTRNYVKNFPYQTVLSGTNSLSTHDQARIANREFVGANNDAMMEIATALQMTYPGVPMVYYGDEIGTRGKSDKDPYNRGTFNWDVNTWSSAGKEMFRDHKTLIATRKANKDAFVYGAFEEIKSHKEDQYIAYARYGKGNRAVVLLNNSNKGGSKNVELLKLYRYGFKNGDVLKDVLTGNTVTVKNDKVNITSKDMTASVWVLSDKAPVRSEEVSFTLTDLSDTRTEVGEVESPVYEEKNGVVTLTWKNALKAGAKEISVRLYDGNKVLAEKIVPITETTASFNKTDLNITKPFTAFVRVIANRENLFNDAYLDGNYKEAKNKNSAGNPPFNGGNETADSSDDEQNKPETKKEIQADNKAENTDNAETSPLDNTTTSVEKTNKIVEILVDSSKKEKVEVAEKIIEKLLKEEEGKLKIKVKNAAISISKDTMTSIFGEKVKPLVVSVKSNSVKATEKELKDLKKHLKKKTLLKDKIYKVDITTDGASLNKILKKEDKVEISVFVSLKKLPKTLYVMDVKTGKVLKAKYDKKKNELKFKTSKLGAFVIIKKQASKKKK